ncbi:hypothetical protein BVRB_9g209370 [Beta vulgaris subsp. vulgaris]|nr:hypothetical protein BVRB_9g209370 [Beta vulgaris subsp. vulgaris]
MDLNVGVSPDVINLHKEGTSLLTVGKIQVEDTVDNERPPQGRDRHHAAVHLEGRTVTPVIQENLDRPVTAGHLETVLNDFQTRMAAVMEEQIKNNMLLFQISPGREAAEPLKGRSEEGRPGTSRPPAARVVQAAF